MPRVVRLVEVLVVLCSCLSVALKINQHISSRLKGGRLIWLLTQRFQSLSRDCCFASKQHCVCRGEGGRGLRAPHGRQEANRRRRTGDATLLQRDTLCGLTSYHTHTHTHTPCRNVLPSSSSVIIRSPTPSLGVTVDTNHRSHLSAEPALGPALGQTQTQVVSK